VVDRAVRGVSVRLMEKCYFASSQSMFAPPI
jgi:hypothetical protein